MLNLFQVAGLVAICMITRPGAAQSKLPLSPLCDLQTSVVQGDHRAVRVKGLYISGRESLRLVGMECSDKSTAVEFALKSNRLKDRFWRASNGSNQVQVVFEGEFYGPRVPDPKLPQAIRNNYHPGWDYDSMTKLVVYLIESVEVVPVGTNTKPH